MKELSIFVDESGDFGEYDYHAPYYIISLVLHDQDVAMLSELNAIENELRIIGWENHCVHAGPVIRSEEEYRGFDLADRQRILSSVFNALLENVEFRKVMPADYRLFQVADIICTLKLVELKMKNHILSKSELYFSKMSVHLRRIILNPWRKKKCKL